MTQNRVEEVQKMTDNLKENGASRDEIQNKIMPFRDLLPKKYQGLNERLEDGYE
jgi:fumarate reductase flavoprotein subunit